MIYKWCIVISDLALVDFALVGPFDTKIEAEETCAEFYPCEIIMSVHPYIKAINWLGKAREQNRMPKELLESHEEFREEYAG